MTMSMSCCVFPSILLNPRLKSFSHSKSYQISVKPPGFFTCSNYLIKFPHKLKFPKFSTNRRYLVYVLSQNGEDEDDPVDDLRVPNHWLDPSKASEESEWLRVTLLKWLDDEYCPEATNIKISDIASRSFFNALMNQQTDLGEILLEMARDLECISYQESFHGAFSSANAAIALIIRRMQPH